MGTTGQKLHMGKDNELGGYAGADGDLQEPGEAAPAVRLPDPPGHPALLQQPAHSRRRDHTSRCAVTYLVPYFTEHDIKELPRFGYLVHGRPNPPPTEKRK